MDKKIVKYIVITAVLFLAVLVHVKIGLASEIILKDNSKIEGTIVKMNDKSVSIKTSLGLLTIPRDKIATINLVDVQNTVPTPQSAVTVTSATAKPAPPGMVYIPSGWFWMGCAPNYEDYQCNKDEKPYHKIYLNAYYIDKNDVTVKEYTECVKAGACKEPGTNKGCNYAVSNKLDHPINCVSWYDSQAYCKYAGKMLPTEAQWEKAARGTDGRIYPWGNQWDASKACVDKDSTCEVGSYPQGKSPYGVLDMAGNVWNWCADWYYKDYYYYTPDHDPQGYDSGTSRVLRGGSWYDSSPSGLRSSCRSSYNPTVLDYSDGFRCVR